MKISKSKRREFETVVLERKSGTAVIKLNRPEVLNAQNSKLIDDFTGALKVVAADTKVTAVIIEGEGRAFCSGYDIGQGYAADADVTDRMQGVTRVMLRVGKPVIAAIQGYCLGGGAEWAMNCDIRIASRDAQFGFPETKVGATITNAGTKLLPLIVGLGRASELLLSGRIIDAETAERWGLVNKVVDGSRLESEAMEMAKSFQSADSLGVSLARLALWYGVSSPIEQVLDFELMYAVAIYAKNKASASKG